MALSNNNNTNNKNNNSSSDNKNNNNNNNNNNNTNNNNCNNNNNKTVTFGGVFHFPTLPKTEAKNMDADSKAVTIKNRFNCGSLRNSLKMVGSNGSTLIAIRLVRSKLRKREENNLHTTNSPPAVTTATANHNNNNINNNNNNNIQPTEVVTTTTTTTVTTAVSMTASENLPPPFLWQYHNGSANTTVASSQYTLYNTDEDTLVHNLPCEEPRECKGFRKNLSGKWRRLVKKKQHQEVYTIPAELKDQLKQIYVY